MKFKHFETKSGKTIKTAQFNGYELSGKLDGITFKVDIQDDGTTKVYVGSEDQELFDEFNTTMWLKKAQEVIDHNPNMILEDPISGEDCFMIPLIKTSTIDEILNSKKNLENIDKASKALEKELSETDEENEVKEPVIGKYKPKRKFINFITGLKGRVRLLNNVAFIKGEQLSGMLEGAIFKITICDENTINFEELDTNLSTPEMIQRFVDDIDSRDVTGYTQKFVISDLKFQDEDANPCYLEVEHKKPIDMLFSLFDKEEEKQTTVSETGMSILDALFSSETDEEIQREFEGESDEEIQRDFPEIEETASQKYMREAFEKMNEEKVEELKNRIEKTEKEISKLKIDVKQAESKIISSSDDLKVLNTRLTSLQPKESPIGYDFFVSTENKTGIEPDENLVAVVQKIAPILKLNTPVVIDMLTKGYYTIKVQKQGPEEDKNKLDKEIYQKIQKIDVIGKVTMTGTCEFEYRGEMTWHQLVDKMIRMGFEQNPDFDKVSGSNSYESKEYEKTDDMTNMKDEIIKMADNLGIKSIAEQHLENIESESETKFKELVSFDEPTDIVIFGHSEDMGTEFKITDDESSFDLFINGKQNLSLNCGGFGSVVTLDDYKNFYSTRGKDIVEYGIAELVEGVVISNFKGTIGIGAMNVNDEIITDIDLNDYIQHQAPRGDHYSVIVNVPGTCKVFKLNEDLSLPVEIIRDIKIENIIK
jgi:hypothetical protein